MRVRVRLFARARELAGREEIEVELPPGCTAAGLRDEIARQAPALKEFVRSCSVAVGDDYAAGSDVIDASRQVALIPPVSGG
jgi:molybdopterin synthase catalytic subunit